MDGRLSFRNFRIGVRLWAGFGLVLCALVGIAIGCGMELARQQSQTELIVADRYAKIEILSDVVRNADRNARYVLGMLLVDEPALVKAQIANVDATRKKIGELLGQLDRKLSLEEGRRLFGVVVEKRTAYAASLGRISEAMAAEQRSEAKRIAFDELMPQQEAYFKAVDELVTFQKKLMDDSVEAGRAGFERARLGLIIAVLAAVALAAGFALVITRSVTAPVERARQVAKALAAGDLAQRIEVDSGDEIGRMLAAMQKAIVHLNGAMGTVRSAAAQVDAGANELSAGNLDLSSRTEQQAANLQETASAVEQITGTVRSNAEAARQADQLANRASSTAAQSSAEVRRVVDTMREISESAGQIASIISVIDGIAFQTNILALNAAVEAARAGETGRGFAVVAGEVRTLAQRSTEAAREIKGLIQRSAESVRTGVEVVDTAGERIDALTACVGQLSELICTISQASQEQATGLEQINTAVAQMDQVTQQNAALVEQLAATGRSLGDQSGTMMQAVSRFRTSHGVPAGAASLA